MNGSCWTACQFIVFVGYYRRFVKDFAELAELLVALTRKGAVFVWTDQQQTAFNALKACLINTPILGFPTKDGHCLLDTYTSLFRVGGGGSFESDSGRSGGGHRVRQPQPSPVSAAILHKTSRNAGGSSDVHAFLVIFAGGSVHPSDGSQLCDGYRNFAMRTGS